MISTRTIWTTVVARKIHTTENSDPGTQHHGGISISCSHPNFLTLLHLLLPEIAAVLRIFCLVETGPGTCSFLWTFGEGRKSSVINLLAGILTRFLLYNLYLLSWHQFHSFLTSTSGTPFLLNSLSALMIFLLVPRAVISKHPPGWQFKLRLSLLAWKGKGGKGRGGKGRERPFSFPSLPSISPFPSKHINILSSSPLLFLPNQQALN